MLSQKGISSKLLFCIERGWIHCTTRGVQMLISRCALPVISFDGDDGFMLGLSCM